VAQNHVKTFAAGTRRSLVGACAAALLWAHPAQAEERVGTPIMPEHIEELPRNAEPSASLFSYLKDRTRLAYGFEENYRDNLLAQDNNRQEEFMSTLEGEIFFSDPRGTLLYGTDYEFNARRYHHKNVEALDQDAHAFLDVDPGGRYKYGFRYDFYLNNSFTFGRESDVDVIQRFAQLRTDVRHSVSGSYRYALNDTNALVPSVSYKVYEVIRPSSANATDRNTLTAKLDMDHDLSPALVFFGGYEFEDAVIPSDSRKDSQAHGIHVGLRHELSQISSLKSELSFVRREFNIGKTFSTPDFLLEWKYLLNPRTTLKFKYTDSNLPSYDSNLLEFRSSSFDGEAAYDLTPLIRTSFGGSYDRTKSTADSLLPGAPSTLTTASDRYGLRAAVEWDIIEKLHVSIYYRYSRATTADYTENNVTIQIEKEL